MKPKLAVVLGFLAASILPAAYLATAFPLSGERDAQSVLGSFFVIYFFAVAATVILGIPVFLVLNKIRLVRWWSALGAGALIGIIAVIAVTFTGSVSLPTVVRYAVLGGAAGLTFWMFWRAGQR